MVKKYIFLFNFSLFLLFSNISASQSQDLNLIGHLWNLCSISQHTASFIRCLHGHVPIKLFKTTPFDARCHNDIFQAITRESIDLRNTSQLTQMIKDGLALSGMTIYTNSFWEDNGQKNAWKEYQLIPNKSLLRYAFVVTEWTKISADKVQIFNNNFDALIIPDAWGEEIYRKSGVKIPIFTLPLVLDLETLLERPVAKRSSSNFVFGFTGLDIHRKNVKLLIKAFAREFKNKPGVSLLLHFRSGEEVGLVREMVRKSNCSNIQVLYKAFTRSEYEDFIASLSCFVLLSKGEGFSIVPREALAAGVPCILSNNTAHKIICDTGYVAAVKSEILDYAYSKSVSKQRGYMFNCAVKDVQKALKDVYQRYDYHWQQAQQGREWTKHYLAENLTPKYMSLVQPKRVYLGRENKITDTYLMVNTPELFYKYMLLCAGTDTIFVK